MRRPLSGKLLAFPARSDLGSARQAIELSDDGIDLPPEVLLTFGASHDVAISNAWHYCWKSKYDHRLRMLYWLLESNGSKLASQKELKDTLSRTVGAHPKWTSNQIKRAADKGYVKFTSADDLPAATSMFESTGDGRARYPLPTKLFHARMQEWTELCARVFIRTYAMARHYHRADLPVDASLPEHIGWDYVAWQRNELPKGRR